jgi:hypothetical protein
MPHKKWGFIDSNGVLVIPVKFDDVARDEYGGRTVYHKPFRNFSEGLCTVRIGKKWGYINNKGDFVIEAKYDGAGQFSEGLACVRDGKKYGYIDKAGILVIPMEFDWPEPSGKASADNPDWDFTKLLLEPLVFSDGRAVAHIHGKCGYIDRTGKIVIEPVYVTANAFDQGYGVVTTPAGVEFIDTNGSPKAPDSHCVSFAEGLFLAHNGFYDPVKRRLFYLDKNGQRPFPQEYADARVFSEGLAAVSFGSKNLETNNSYGYIDTSGTMVIQPQFHVSGNNLAADFIDGRAIVSELSIGPTGHIKNLHGVIDRSGRWIVRPKYEHISSYSDGLARALRNSHWVFLDMDGNEVVQTTAAWVNSYSEGLAAVME